MPFEPDEEKLAGDETLRITKEERASFLARAAALQAAHTPCPVCGLPNAAFLKYGKQTASCAARPCQAVSINAKTRFPNFN
jgi:hypothetical protein